MAKINFHKIKLELPAILESNAIYFVERLDGFDLYTTSSDIIPIAKKINSGDYIESSLGILVPNNGSNIFNLVLIESSIEKSIEITYQAKRQALVEIGLVKISSSLSDVYREAEFDDCGLIFEKVLDGQQIQIKVSDSLKNGIATIINVQIKIKILNY